jgi:hypothetical protein
MSASLPKLNRVKNMRDFDASKFLQNCGLDEVPYCQGLGLGSQYISSTDVCNTLEIYYDHMNDLGQGAQVEGELQKMIRQAKASTADYLYKKGHRPSRKDPSSWRSDREEPTFSNIYAEMISARNLGPDKAKSNLMLIIRPALLTFFNAKLSAAIGHLGTQMASQSQGKATVPARCQL